MKYPLKQLKEDFPNDTACLEWLVDWLYPNGITCRVCRKVTKHHKDRARRSYSCDRCGKHMHPTAGTIFHNSRVPLTDWFHAIWLMSSQKNGTTAKQIEREIGVSYKTAWRMMHQIRKMMDSEDEILMAGDVEIDETYIHPNPFKRSSARRNIGRDARRTGWVVLGIVQRGGPVKVWHVPSTGARAILPKVINNVAYGSTIHTDGWRLYRSLPGFGFEHKWVDHGKGQYFTDDSHTQNIENFWSTFKRGLKGSYIHIGRKYIQAYADEFAWRYSHRNDVNMFWSLMLKIRKS